MGRTPCCDRNGLKKGPWTPEEDQKLIQYIQKHGPGNWRTLPKNAGLQRCGKSCRLRWTNYLRPDIKRGRFSFEEEETIIQLHSILGNKWSAMAARLPGRTDNEIKNYWNTHIRKRLLRNGIDPVTHAPRLDLLDLSSLLRSSLQSTALINLSNLLGAQALVNPELLRMVTAVISLKQQNPQTLQENQLCTSHPQNQVPFSQPNQFQPPLHQVPAAGTGCGAPPASFPDETQLLQSAILGFPSQPTTNLGHTTSQEGLTENLASQTNQVFCSTSDGIPSQSELLDFQNISRDSVVSTPMSSPTPLNSSSTEDERESYCSNLLKLELLEGLDISEFL